VYLFFAGVFFRKNIFRVCACNRPDFSRGGAGPSRTDGGFVLPL